MTGVQTCALPIYTSNTNKHFHRRKGMGLDYFKDTVFELLNDSDDMAVKDIQTKDKENIFTVLLMDGSHFELECRQIY